MNKQRGYTLVFSLAWLTLVGFAIYGWGMNIYKLIVMAQADTVPQITLMLVLRIVGIFAAPVGAVLGYF